MPANALAWLARGPAFGTTSPTAPSVASAGRSPIASPCTTTTLKTWVWCPAKSFDVLAAALPESTSTQAQQKRKRRSAFTNSERTRLEASLDELVEHGGAERACDRERPARRACQKRDPPCRRRRVRRKPDEARHPEHQADGRFDGVEGDSGGKPV